MVKCPNYCNHLIHPQKQVHIFHIQWKNQFLPHFHHTQPPPNEFPEHPQLQFPYVPHTLLIQSHTSDTGPVQILPNTQCLLPLPKRRPPQAHVHN